MSRPNLYDYLKILAVLTMIVDHVGYFFFPGMLVLRLIGRIAFPIFLFLVGFSLSYKWRRDLFLGAILVQILFMIFDFHMGQPYILNILRGIIAARAFLSWYQKKHNYSLLILFSLIFLGANVYLYNRIDYGGFAFLFPLMGYLFRKEQKNVIQNLIYGIVIFGLFLVNSVGRFGFSHIQLFVISICFIFLLSIFFLLGQENKRIYLAPKLDSAIFRIARNALRIYIVHIIILSGIRIYLIYT